MKRVLSIVLLSAITLNVFGSVDEAHNKRALELAAGKTKGIVVVKVDLQNDFCEGGSLAVTKADQEYKNQADEATKFFEEKNIVIIDTRDWHTPGHISFAKTHSIEPFHQKEIDGKMQTLWPDHCVQSTKGAEFITPIREDHIILSKGTEEVESYSAVIDEAGKQTELPKILDEIKAKKAIVFGLAFNFCVGKTALDLAQLGKEVHLIFNLSPGVVFPDDIIDAPTTWVRMAKALQDAGVTLHYVESINSGSVTEERAKAIAAQGVAVNRTANMATLWAAVKAKKQQTVAAPAA